MFLKKSGSKRDSVEASSSKNSEMVFTLLDKVIAVHIGLTLIYVGDFGLEKLFSRFIEDFSSRSDKVPEF